MSLGAKPAPAAGPPYGPPIQVTPPRWRGNASPQQDMNPDLYRQMPARMLYFDPHKIMTTDGPKYIGIGIAKTIVARIVSFGPSVNTTKRYLGQSPEQQRILHQPK